MWSFVKFLIFCCILNLISVGFHTQDITLTKVNKSLSAKPGSNQKSWWRELWYQEKLSSNQKSWWRELWYQEKLSSISKNLVNYLIIGISWTSWTLSIFYWLNCSRIHCFIHHDWVAQSSLKFKSQLTLSVN